MNGYNIRGENLERAWNLVSHEFCARSESVQYIRSYNIYDK